MGEMREVKMIKKRVYLIFLSVKIAKIKKKYYLCGEIKKMIL